MHHTILSYIKKIIYRPIGIYKVYWRTKVRRNTSKKRIYLLNIPSHGNLGDHLISVAEQQFFTNNFPEKEVILITSADLYFSIRFALMDVCEDDILCVTGGGFMGSLYEEEDRFLTIMKRFPNNKIIFFPQTIYYEPTPKGEEQIKRAAKVYMAHKYLYFMARDKTSYELLQTRLMPNATHRVYLIPDIALYAPFSQDNVRSNILWCLRQDTEININNSPIIQKIKKIVEEKQLTESNTDTYVFRSISLEDENREVQLKAEEISKARLVITDRLHGMIYSLITDTPVIALDNLSKKVAQVYNLWLKNIPFVQLVDMNTDIPSIIEHMLAQTDCHYDNCEIRKKYQPIIDAINE